MKGFQLSTSSLLCAEGTAWLCASMEKFGQTSVGHMQLHSHIGVLKLAPKAFDDDVVSKALKIPRKCK